MCFTLFLITLLTSGAAAAVVRQLFFFGSSTSKSNQHNCNNESEPMKAKRKHRYHLNSLWSIWYGILFTYFQGYLILNGAYRFLGKNTTDTFQ